MTPIQTTIPAVDLVAEIASLKRQLAGQAATIREMARDEERLATKLGAKEEEVSRLEGRISATTEDLARHLVRETTPSHYDHLDYDEREHWLAVAKAAMGFRR